VERRIFGLENEYGVTCTLRGQRRLSPDEVARYLFRRVVSWGRVAQRLPGQRRPPVPRRRQPPRVRHAGVRLDPRPGDPRQGRRAHPRAAPGVGASTPAGGGHPGVIYLFKNNTDSAGNSYGCHENYLTSRRDDFSHYAEVLIPFFVSRQIYAGAGKVLQTARGAMYCIAQRAEHIWEGVSSATTRSRPIINTRDEPHADAERYRRLHVIVGDSNMSEYATFLKVGATSILLRMLEDPSFVLRDMTLENPIRAIREISHDLTGKRTVRLANGREASALDIQGEYLERAKRYAETKGLSPLEDKALAMWEYCLNGLESDPFKLDRECDWVIKHKLIEAYCAKHDLPLSHPKVALIDLQYHDVNRERACSTGSSSGTWSSG
jgi:proteasome accessory factor A